MSEPTQNPQGTASFRVPDMACGHCASTIRSAIERAVPGATVSADPQSKLVSVTGAGGADLRAIIAAAGYTPEAAQP